MKLISSIILCFLLINGYSQDLTKKHIIWVKDESSLNAIFDDAKRYNIINNGDINNKSDYSFVCNYKKEYLYKLLDYPDDYYVLANLKETSIGVNWELKNLQKELEKSLNDTKNNPNDTSKLSFIKQTEISVKRLMDSCVYVDNAIKTQQVLVDSIKKQLDRNVAEKAFDDIYSLLEFSSKTQEENKIYEIKYFDGNNWYFINRESFNEEKVMIFDSYLNFLLSL